MTRKKLAPPGSRIRIDMSKSRTPAEWDEISDELMLSLAFTSDFNYVLDLLLARRKDFEASGLDAYEALARMFAHNLAVKERILREKAKGSAIAKAKAAARRREIDEQLNEAGGQVKVVALDRKLSGLPSSSERTIRRVKKCKTQG